MIECTMNSERKAVLCIGLVCIDVIQVCKSYPKEDSDDRGTVICPWGEQGAMSYSKHQGFAEACAYPPQEVVDTWGAGDTFVAATISHLMNGFNVKQSIEFGCKVAGIRVGISGYKSIKQTLNDVLS